MTSRPTATEWIHIRNRDEGYRYTGKTKTNDAGLVMREKEYRSRERNWVNQPKDWYYQKIWQNWKWPNENTEWLNDYEKIALGYKNY
jgi:hypothetical protein